MKEITYTKVAIKTLRKMPRKDAARIRNKVLEVASDTGSQDNNIKALKGAADLFRLRVGDWRVIFSDDGLIIMVEKIGSRGGVY